MSIQRAPGPGENGIFGQPATEPTMLAIAAAEYNALRESRDRHAATLRRLRDETACTVQQTQLIEASFCPATPGEPIGHV